MALRCPSRRCPPKRAEPRRNAGPAAAGMSRTLLELATGGRVMVDSEPGRGTAFHVMLPLQADATAVRAPADGP